MREPCCSFVKNTNVTIKLDSEVGFRDASYLKWYNPKCYIIHFHFDFFFNFEFTIKTVLKYIAYLFWKSNFDGWYKYLDYN